MRRRPAPSVPKWSASPDVGHASREWPKHVEEKAELYVVLKGEVIYITDREQAVKAGEAILLAPGEPHGARVEEGAVSINVDFARARAGRSTPLR